MFGPGNAPAGSSTEGFNYDDISLTPILQAYYTSFVLTQDPNSNPVDGSVGWPEFYTSESRILQRILFQTNATTVETIPKKQLDKCRFWGGLGVKLQQ